MQPGSPSGAGTDDNQQARGNAAAAPSVIQRASSLPAPANAACLPQSEGGQQRPHTSGQPQVLPRTSSEGELDQPARKSSLWKRASVAIARVLSPPGGQDANEAGPDCATVQSDAVSHRILRAPHGIQRAASLPGAHTSGRSQVLPRTSSEGELDQPARKSSLWKRASAAIARVGLRSGGQDANEAGPDYAAVQSEAVAQRKLFAEGSGNEKTRQGPEVALYLEAREEKASRILQRNYRSHVARTIYKGERFVQLESPANIIVGAAKMFLARRSINYYRRAWALVRILENNWRAPLARRKLQRMKFSKQHTKMYKIVAREILNRLLAETFQPTCIKVTRDWAADVIGRSFRCNRARLIFWTRFDQIDQLENDIGLDMTAPILIQSMAASFRWSEKNSAAAKLQSCIRVQDARIYRDNLKEYDDFINESAIMIQCAFRSYLAREKVLMWDTPKCNDAALMLQLAFRCMRERGNFRERRREWEFQTLNAIIIQTQCRVHLALRRFWTRELDVEWPPSFAISSGAALKVQRVFRGHGARIALRTYVLSNFVMMQIELEVKQRTSARKVQLAWRCHLARREWAITLHNSYSLVLGRIRDKRRAVEQPQYDHLVIQDQELAEAHEAASDEQDSRAASEDESDGRTSTPSSPFGKVGSSVHVNRRVARKLQAVYRGHLARSQIREQWGWDYQEVTQAQMLVWHRKMAAKKIQHFWRGYRERKKFLAARLERRQKKEAIEAEFQADPTLRRVLVLNREVRVQLTAIEEAHGTRVCSSSPLTNLLSFGQQRPWEQVTNTFSKLNGRYI